MVKHPRYQAMDDARERAIPLLYLKYCKYDYKLEIIPPVKEKDPKPGPIPRPTFRMLNLKDNLVAHFHPYGTGKCYKDDFKPTFDKIMQEIDKAAKEALALYEGH